MCVIICQLKHSYEVKAFMYSKEALKEKYKDSIIVGRKPMHILIEYLKSKGNVVQIPQPKIPSSIIGGMIYNMKSLKKEYTDFIECIKHPENYMNENFSFVGYEFPNNAENAEFYKNYQPNQDNATDNVYVIFETNSQFFECNCSKLYLELTLFQGVENDDIKHETPEFFRHLFFIHTLKEWDV